MKFVDEARIFVKSGDGGRGCVSFHREKFIEFGGPDGGDGGRGGDVIAVAVNGLNTLVDYRFQQHIKARNGEPGKGRLMSGESRDAVLVKVPVGTQIYLEDGETMLADLTKEGDEVLLAKGGDGGKGNARFKTSTNQAPRKTTPGFPGEEKIFYLRLKLISDAGIIGLPNAGKSTFLSVVSRAKPKIADYPFTTLQPQLGVVRAGEVEFVIADIPGLIEGASEGVGLGTKFLGHVERAGVLLHLIDGMAEDVAKNYKTIRSELKQYSPALAKKKEVLCLNKVDALTPKEIKEKVAALKKASRKTQVYEISAAGRQNVDEVLKELYKIIEKCRNAG